MARLMHDESVMDTPPELCKPERATPGKDPAPLGAHPSSDEALDVAVQYTFPASDPMAVGASVRAAEAEEPPALSTPPASAQRSDFEWPRGPGR
jgi:hypothetical protein